jgi:hypothetical protein
MAEVTAPPTTDAARQRLALAQTALLSALVADTPVPEGFDRGRVRLQSRALRAKRADVVAKVAPEVPEILGTGYRPAFLAYAADRPMGDAGGGGGFRRDALFFVEHLLNAPAGGTTDAATREALAAWWRERAGPAPLPPTGRVRHRVRAVLAVVRVMPTRTGGGPRAFNGASGRPFGQRLRLTRR